MQVIPYSYRSHEANNEWDVDRDYEMGQHDNLPALDTRWPAYWGTTGLDAPGTLLDSAWQAASACGTYRMYLMWMPPGGGVFVPLEKASWTWGGLAVNNNPWALSSGSGSVTGYESWPTPPEWNTNIIYW